MVCLNKNPKKKIAKIKIEIQYTMIKEMRSYEKVEQYDA